MNDALLVRNNTDLEALILGLLDDFMSVEAVKGFSRILAGYNRLVSGYSDRQMDGLRPCSPTSASRRIEAPPGCMFLNRLMS